MLKTSPAISQRLVRKGALIEETYNLFKNWKEEMSFDQNFNHTFDGGFRSEAWKKEIHSTLRRRFRDLKTAKSLIVLARSGYDISDWKYCLHFYIAIHEVLYRLFLATWLYPEYQSGRFSLRTEDVVQHVLTVWKSNNPRNSPLSEYGAIRTARDLLRMARDFGLLEGEGPAKIFSQFGAGAKTMAYYRVEFKTDAISVEEFARIFTRLTGWSTGKAAGHSMMAFGMKHRGPVSRTAIDQLHSR